MKKFVLIIALFAVSGLFTSCNDDTLALPDLTVSFSSSSTNIAEDESQITVDLTFSRAITAESEISLSLAETGLVYGTDYSTSPAATNGTLQLTVPVNATSSSFTITKIRTSFDGEENLEFTISDLSEELFIGENEGLKVNFTEVVATTATIDPTVGGATQPNTVYIDFSASRQTVVARSGWDLGFHSAGSDFRVIINPHVTAMTQALDKTDLNSVTEADSSGMTGTMDFAAFHPLAVNWVDDPSGDITKTAIAEISTTDSENKVYLLNRGTDANGQALGWKKIRVVQLNGAYVLQHADINAANFMEVTITKDAAYNFSFFSFENGEVDVEPKKDRWDLAFSVHHTFLNFGGGNVPYSLNDMVFHNRTGVSTIMLDEATYGTYEDFTATKATSITLSSNQVEIGSSWRNVFDVAVFDDRFYLLQDADGNVYKLRFDRLALNGERGFPQFSYELLD